MGSGNVYFAEHEGLVVLKFVGEIRYIMGDSRRLIASLSALLDDLFERQDFENVLIDLREATSVDSTNLGLLARISQFTQKTFGRKPTLLSTDEDLNELLEGVGFDQVFTIIHDPEHPHLALEALPETPSSDKSLAEIMLDAHRALVELNEKNKQMFKDVVQMMQDEVDKGD